MQHIQAFYKKREFLMFIFLIKLLKILLILKKKKIFFFFKEIYCFCLKLLN
jgi:hypothetical protein